MVRIGPIEIRWRGWRELEKSSAAKDAEQKVATNVVQKFVEEWAKAGCPLEFRIKELH